MPSDKGTENSKQLVTTELPLAQKIFCVPPRDKTQWKKWERIRYPNAGAPTSEG